MENDKLRRSNWTIAQLSIKITTRHSWPMSYSHLSTKEVYYLGRSIWWSRLMLFR